LLIDTHIHVFVRGLPLALVRRYVPDYDATIDDYRARMAAHGITHAVLVQPSFLGTDNSFMRDALRRHRTELRGIAVVDPTIDDEELARLDADGVVGIRLNLDSLPIPQFATGPWPGLLRNVAKRGWHVEVHREGRDLPQLVGPLVDAGVDVVVDHFGRPDDELGIDDPGFRYLLTQGPSRRVWVKLSAAYRNGSGGRGLATAPKAAALLLEHLGRDRLVFGSDWPHTRHESYNDIGSAWRQFESWIPDAADRAYIAGPGAFALYRF
jgi:predicted TIM-barrel fold metal-dependent hydrolase